MATRPLGGWSGDRLCFASTSEEAAHERLHQSPLLPLRQNTILAVSRHWAHTLVPCGERRDTCRNRKSISALVDSPADERKSFFRRKGLSTSTAMSSTTRLPWTNCWPGALSRCRCPSGTTKW